MKMTSRLLEFALRKGAINDISENTIVQSDSNTIAQSDSDEISQRLEAELAQLQGDMYQLNESSQKSTIQLPTSGLNQSLKIMPEPKLSGVNEKSQITMTFPAESNTNIRNNGPMFENNNMKSIAQSETPMSSTSLPDQRFINMDVEKSTIEQLNEKTSTKSEPPINISPNPLKNASNTRNEDASSESKMKEGGDSSKTWKCEECGTKLKARFTLEMHINTKHKHIKAFSCNLCEHKSAQRANLNVHMMATHNQTEKFQCNICQKMLDGKREIGNHIKSEHGRSGASNLYTSCYVTFIEP